MFDSIIEIKVKFRFCNFLIILKNIKDCSLFFVEEKVLFFVLVIIDSYI